MAIGSRGTENAERSEEAVAVFPRMRICGRLGRPQRHPHQPAFTLGGGHAGSRCDELVAVPS